MAAALPAADQEPGAARPPPMLPDAEHPLFLLFATLGASEIAAGNPTNSATLLEFARILEGHGFYTQEDVTAPTVFRPTIEDMMDEVTGLDPGLRALFCRALKPGDSLAGFEWADPPQQHQEAQRQVGKKRPQAPSWSTASKFDQMSLPPGAPVPTLKSMGVFDGVTCPATSGAKLKDRAGFGLIIERTFSAAQDHPELQGGGCCERVKAAWEKELHEWCPPRYMPEYGKKERRTRVWDLKESFSNRRNKTYVRPPSLLTLPPPAMATATPDPPPPPPPSHRRPSFEISSQRAAIWPRTLAEKVKVAAQLSLRAGRPLAPAPHPTPCLPTCY